MGMGIAMAIGGVGIRGTPPIPAGGIIVGVVRIGMVGGAPAIGAMDGAAAAGAPTGMRTAIGIIGARFASDDASAIPSAEPTTLLAVAVAVLGSAGFLRRRLRRSSVTQVLPRRMQRVHGSPSHADFARWHSTHARLRGTSPGVGVGGGSVLAVLMNGCCAAAAKPVCSVGAVLEAAYPEGMADPMLCSIMCACPLSTKSDSLVGGPPVWPKGGQ